MYDTKSPGVPSLCLSLQVGAVRNGVYAARGAVSSTRTHDTLCCPARFGKNRCPVPPSALVYTKKYKIPPDHNGRNFSKCGIYPLFLRTEFAGRIV